MGYEYQGNERSFARAQGLVSAILTLSVLVSVGAESNTMTGLFSVLLSFAHSFHFWYFAIRTDLGSPHQLYLILTGPRRPLFWPAPLLIAYAAAVMAYPALFWVTYKSLVTGGAEAFGSVEKATLIFFWSIFIYFYTDRLVSDVFIVKFEFGRVLYTTVLLFALGGSMSYSGLIQSMILEE
jgi:hypothetical protein